MNRYPSLVYLGFVIAGIVIADHLQLSSVVLILSSLATASAGLYFFMKDHIRSAAIAVGLCLMFFSGAHFGLEVYEKGPGHVENVAQFKERYHIFGQVVDWPEFRGRFTQVELELDSIGTDRFQPTQGKILLKISDSTTSIQRGDKLEFWGRMYGANRGGRTGEFDYGRFLSLKGISATVYVPTVLNVRVNRSERSVLFEYVDRLRFAIKRSFARNLSPEAAALASGFLIGDTRDIPPDIYRYFRDSGTLHLLAVSGSNVAVVVMFFLFCFRWMGLNRTKTNLILLGVIVLFALLSYGEPSVIRASVMASLVLLAQLLERKFDTNNLIAGAALLILLFSPAQLFNVGFQLSFVTAWGLILAAVSLEKIWGNRKHRWYYYWLVMPVCLTLAAQLFSTPLIALYFHRIPILSLAANLMIIPLVSIAVIGIMLLLVADLFLPFLGQVVGMVLEVIIIAVTKSLEFFGAQGVPILTVGQLSPVWIVLILVGLVAATFALTSRVGRRYCLIGVIVITNIGLAAAIIGKFVGPPSLSVSVARIPGGTAVVVEGSLLQNPDIVLTGIESRDYPIDERILEPLLKQRSISKLGRIIVFGAGFDALDDIIRLAQQFDADSVLLPGELIPSFRDASRAESKERDFVGEIVAVGTSKGSQIRVAGVRFESRSYSVLADSINLVISRTSKSPLSLDHNSNYGSLLVVDPGYYLGDSEGQFPTILPHQIIVCAKYEQLLSDLMKLYGAQADTSRIVDLRKSGQILIEWPDRFSQPILRPVFN